MSCAPLQPSAFDHHPDAVMRLCAVRADDGGLRDFRCTYLNQNARAVFAWKQPGEPLLSQVVSGFANEDLTPALDEALRTGMPCRQKKGTLELTVVKEGDGLVVFVRQPSPSSDTLAPIQQQQLLDDLDRRRRRLETMFSANLIGNVTWRLDGRIVTANEAFLKSVGYTGEDLEAGRLSWRALTPPEFAEMDGAKLDELRAKRYHTPYEKEFIRKDGSRVPVLVSAALFPDSEDEGIAYIVDLSKVKKAEKRIRELLDQVTTASRAKDEFLATLANELRNPLAPIRNAVEILKAEGPPDPKLVWSRSIIDRQVRHMSRLLEDLLDISRLSRDKLELRREVVDIATVIEAALETSRPLLEAGRHHVSLNVPTGTIFVDGDPIRLAQVFANLLNNAAKYTPDGGAIEVNVARNFDGGVTVSVRDDGIGITAAMLPFVFDMFSRVEPTRGRAQGGLGIGLSLVKGLIEMHGGTVTAHSDGPNMGTELRVRLPVVAGTNRGEPDEPAVARPVATGHRVLVVDDNVDNADTLASLFEMMGNQVAKAYDGEAALEVAEAFRPTVMLLDIGMPRMNGLEVCRRVRAKTWGREPLVIAMTGWGQADDRQETQAAGMDHHIVKPVDVAALLKILTERGSSPRTR